MVFILLSIHTKATKKAYKMTTIIKSEAWYVENIKQKSGFHDVSRHIDTRKTKKALGIKGKVKKLKVMLKLLKLL